MTGYEKRGYLLENFRLFHLHTPQGTKVDYHYHEFYKILFFRSGSGDYVVEGQRYRLQPGDIVMIGSRCVHRPEIEEGNPYERVILYIDPSYLQQSSTEGCQLADIFTGGAVLRLREAERKRIDALVVALEKEMSGHGYGRDVLSSAWLLRLLVEIGRCSRHRDTENPRPVMSDHPRVRQWLQYMDQHLTEDLDVDSLAETFYISKYHMMRLFHKETGFTVHSYLSHRRLLYARELMNGGMRATEACYRCGFRSYSSFTRSYGKYFGTTPTGRLGDAGKDDAGYE